MHFKLLLTFALICTALAEDAISTDAPTDIPDDSNDTTTTITTTETTTTETTSTETTTTTPLTTTPTTPPPTTTTEAPKTTVAPATSYLYNVTEQNVTCIMLEGDLTFKITYNIGGNETNSTMVSIPKPSESVNVEGSCSSPQYMKISWGQPEEESSVMFTFGLSKDDKSWTLTNFSSEIYISPQNKFVNATDEDKSLISEATLVMNPVEIPVNHSLKCFSSLSFDNFTTTMDGGPYAYPIHLSVNGIQVQAYNKISFQNKFVDEIHCSADKIADIVPIAVGCALAALVIIVLVAYVIGRRRRSAAYQSV